METHLRYKNKKHEKAHAGSDWILTQPVWENARSRRKNTNPRHMWRDHKQNETETEWEQKG